MLKDLGAKRTPTDPDGSKHRLGFWAFCLAMLVLIAALIVIRADDADAVTPVCRGPFSARSPEAAGTAGIDNWFQVNVGRWCGGTDGAHARWDGGAPSFSRSYHEGLWSFSKWFDTKTQIGYATAPDGDRDVQYKAWWGGAEFKLCVGVGGAQLCEHRTQSVRVWAWANGNYTVKPTRADGALNTVPNLPMPRP
jgi:hypothetical protein